MDFRIAKGNAAKKTYCRRTSFGCRNANRVRININNFSMQINAFYLRLNLDFIRFVNYNIIGAVLYGQPTNEIYLRKFKYGGSDE